MAWDKTLWPPPLAELAGGMAGHLPAWEGTRAMAPGGLGCREFMSLVANATTRWS